jgi:ribosomal protein L28
LKQRLAKLGKPSIRRGQKLSDESREKMRIAAKTRPRNSGYTLSSKAIINNKVSHLKGTLYRHPDRCIQVSLDNKTLWFVNEGEASRFYIGTNKAIRILQNKMENHFFIPVSVKQENSKGWQTLKNATVSSCSLEELLEHRPELRH